MHIDKYKTADGYSWEYDGLTYDDHESLIQCGILGFCGCGMPSENLAYVRDGLAYIAEDRKPADTVWDAWFAARKIRAVEVFGSEAAKHFFYYWADKEGLTEHGYSHFSCWLSEKGKELLEDLQAVDLEEEAD